MDQPRRVRGGQTATRLQKDVAHLSPRACRFSHRGNCDAGASTPIDPCHRRAPSRMKTSSPWVPTSWMAMTFGCDSLAIACASRCSLTRAAAVASTLSSCASISLSATFRSSSGSKARYTAPIAPAPQLVEDHVAPHGLATLERCSPRPHRRRRGSSGSRAVVPCGWPLRPRVSLERYRRPLRAPGRRQSRTSGH